MIEEAAIYRRMLMDLLQVVKQVDIDLQRIINTIDKDMSAPNDYKFSFMNLEYRMLNAGVLTHHKGHYPRDECTEDCEVVPTDANVSTHRGGSPS